MTVFKVAGTSDRERRAYRRAVLEQLAEQEPRPREPASMSVAEGARLLLEGFERGDELLFGYPKDRVDFASAYDSLKERAG